MNEDIGVDAQMRNQFRQLGVCLMCTYRYTENKTSSLPLKLSAMIEDEKAILNEETNTCIVCLGLLQQTVVQALACKVSKLMLESDFDCSSYMLAIKLPSCVYIREHSLCLHLKSDYPSIYEKTCRIPYQNLKDVWRAYLSTLLKSTLQKNLSAKSPLIITVNACYADDVDECRPLDILAKQRKRKSRNLFSNDTISYALELFPEKTLFIKYFPSPPSKPAHFVTCDSLSLLRESIYCAGRYNKWSRILSQTPWILDGERIMENSVEEIITMKLVQAFKAEVSKFSSSGREDVDVRTLGNGRPFAVELINPRVSSLPNENIRQIEDEINRSAYELIFIKDLQIISRDKLKYLKEGEENKRKEYCALCVIYSHVDDQFLEKCCSSITTPFVIQQKTPIRVLHRRPVAVRPRTIYNMKITLVNGDAAKGRTLVKLYVTTQAGAYIKEFVHGDFGRTVPNFSDFIGGIPVDILALDVTNVEVNWPAPVTY